MGSLLAATSPLTTKNGWIGFSDSIHSFFYCRASTPSLPQQVLTNLNKPKNTPINQYFA